jgi:hypothetical protein
MGPLAEDKRMTRQERKRNQFVGRSLAAAALVLPSKCPHYLNMRTRANKPVEPMAAGACCWPYRLLGAPATAHFLR